MVLVNLCGPPAAGKSTFAARFVAEHPEFRYCSIDAYRCEYEHEATAWVSLLNDIIESKDVVLETCGTNWKLERIFRHEIIEKRPTISILMTAPYKTLIDRLGDRQNKRPTPPIFDNHDEVQALVFHQTATLVMEYDIYIDTSTMGKQQVYTYLVDKINEKRISSSRGKINKVPLNFQSLPKDYYR